MKYGVNAHSVFGGLGRTIKRKFHVFYYAFHELKVNQRGQRYLFPEYSATEQYYFIPRWQ